MGPKPFRRASAGRNVRGMDERIIVEGFEVPKNRRSSPEGEIVDIMGWLRAPVDWDGGIRLEHLWNRRHARSRLGVGLSVANNPRRHFIISNTRGTIEQTRAELESLIAELENVPEDEEVLEA